MTLNELTHLTARLLGYDSADDLDAAPRQLIAGFLNQAAVTAAKDRWTPITTEEVTLDGDATLPEVALTQRVETVWEVTVEGQPRFFRRLGLTVLPYLHVPGCENKAASVTYGYLPPELTEDDEPQLPAWFHPHLADFAAARMLGQGDAAQQNRSRFFLDMWYDALARLRGVEHQAEGWRGLYRH